MTSARIRTAAVLAALAVLLAACGGGGGGGATSAADAPSFVAADLSGGQVDSASFAGQPTVLWFWAPWCTICRAEAPGVVDAATQVGDEVTLVGVAGRGEVPAMRDFVDQTGTGAFTHVVDDDGSIWADYGVTAQPAFAFLAADGSVDEVVAGPIEPDRLVERMRALASA